MLRFRFLPVVAVLAGGAWLRPRRRDALRRVRPGRRKRRRRRPETAAEAATRPPAGNEERGKLLLRQRHTPGTAELAYDQGWYVQGSVRPLLCEPGI